MAEGRTPTEILDLTYQRALEHPAEPIVNDPDILERVNLVARNLQNRACVQVLLACLLAKAHDPEVDIRKPYTEIGGSDSYSGRSYDEKYITAFVYKHQLPCLPTSGFLTPGFRTKNTILTPDVELGGRPRSLYKAVLQLLTDVQSGRVAADDLRAEAVRSLLLLKGEREQRIRSLLEGLKASGETTPLSSEGIVALIEQHLRFRRAGSPGASRLPVLVVAAAYQAASERLGERTLPLQFHTAANQRTGALGDVEVTLVNDDNVVTSYEMKTRRVTRDNIDRALQKLEETGKRVDNYIFITTEDIDPLVQEYAVGLYDEVGIEFVLLDCIGFLRHFLHLFHRLRTRFLDAYQELLLAQPESAISQPIKEAFLAMRQAAESGE